MLNEWMNIEYKYLHFIVTIAFDCISLLYYVVDTN